MPVPSIERQPDRLAYSPAEAALVIGISRAQLYKYLSDGTLASFHVGRRRLVRHESLVALLDLFAKGGSDVA